jgi:hypothetical protein
MPRIRIRPSKKAEAAVMTASEVVPVPPGTPAKQKVEMVPAPPEVAKETGKSAEVVVTAEKPGEVNFVDKLKGYYHTVITVTGAILLLLNQVTPITDALGGEVQKWISAAIIFVTALLNFLKSNEQWINKP